jgi:hypothetical protein
LLGLLYRTTEMNPVTRRRFLQHTSLATAALLAGGSRSLLARGTAAQSQPILGEFGYGNVTLASELHAAQLGNTHAVLMALSEDSILKPLRQMSGMPAPGAELGSWYAYEPDYDYTRNFDQGFAPGCTFGQWVSALARGYAITGDEATREKVLRLNRLYAKTITPDFYIRNRFPAYTYDKLLLGLLDSHTLARDPEALAILEHTTKVALPHLPGRAIEHGLPWRADKDPHDDSWTWDESYTCPENMFIAYERGAGRRYYELALQYLDDQPWFDRLANNEHVLGGRHAYSHVNSLCSAAKAYMVAGSAKHLRAAQNAFTMLQAQSYATGGWGPDETLCKADSNELYESLTGTHHHFETPCGAYAHFKLTRYLLRVTRDSRYGDSMERVMYNTVLGAKPLLLTGENFYYADYNFNARRTYKEAHWACCSGTLPQVATDYRINAYFSEPGALYVNLYIPSTLRWKAGGVALSLTQQGSYPYDSQIRFTLRAARPAQFTLQLRIPEWARGASISVNGERLKLAALPGTFAAIPRHWSDGDRIDLELPMSLRLEPIDTRHPDTVALLNGPLALMTVKARQDSPLPALSRGQLLGAKRTNQQQWRLDTTTGPLTLLPFTALGELPYTTYLQVS